ncbi:MAG: hypothetical protein ACYCVZ_15445, partial [Streptosporangiaceae bacterium]
GARGGASNLPAPAPSESVLVQARRPGAASSLEPELRLAAAVFVDTTVVRGAGPPAALALLGDRGWYLPRWLRWLPAGLYA